MDRATIRSILVPTDFSQPANVAFAHALRLALALKAELDIFHVEPHNDTTDWRWAPPVLETLIRWGFLEEGATEADLARLGIRARRTLSSGERPDEAILHEMASSHADLVVMASHGRSGIARWLQPSVSRPVALRAPVPVLLIPADSKGFVDEQTGYGTVSRVLLPVDVVPDPGPAFDAAGIFSRALPGDSTEFATFHVGLGHPALELMQVPAGARLHHWRAEGGVVESIATTAFTWSADLVIVVTEGRQNFLDALRGSTVERLMGATPKPLLIVPAGWGSWTERPSAPPVEMSL